MTRLSWGGLPAGYEVGVDHGVLYLASGVGVAWNGLTDVTDDTPSAPSDEIYIDGQRQPVATVKTDFQGSLEAYTYPSEFEHYIGYLDEFTAQPRDSFGLSFRTKLANGHRIHLVYNITAELTGWDAKTLTQNPEPSMFNWKLKTVPEIAEDLAPTAHIYIDTSEAHTHTVALFEELIYGTASTDPTLPSIQEIIDFFEENALFIVVDHGDGTWTATGPDDMIQMLDATTFQITSPTAIPIDAESYTLSTY